MRDRLPCFSPLPRRRGTLGPASAFCPGVALRSALAFPSAQVLGHSLGPALAVLLLSNLVLNAEPDWLDRLDQSLFIQSPKGFFRTDLSGLLDLDGYYIDQLPPGLLFSDDDLFFNPRLSLFLDTKIGPHFYSLVQARFDRGFDPGLKPDGDARLDEYLLRYIPFDDNRINLQAGKFATAVGNWVPRHESWQNPFITAPVPYENFTIVSDQTVPDSPAAFLARRGRPDNRPAWLPLIWGPSYASGASLFGRLKKFEYAFEIKNGGLSSRPSVWDATELSWEYPTLSARLGFQPNATWDFGASISEGTYLLPGSEPFLPAGTALGDYKQLTIGHDIRFAWRHWQLWAELFAARFEVPNVGNADTLAYYLETKYKISTHLYAALRWNQQFFDDIPDGTGGRQPWDNDLWKADAALGYRFNRHFQTKIQYSYSHQKGPLQQGEQLLAGQFTLRF